MGDRSIDDEDFGYDNQGEGEIDYGDEYDDMGQATAKSTMVQNQPHDEEVALSDTGSLGGRDDPPSGARGVDRAYDASLIESNDDMPGPPGQGGDSGDMGGSTSYSGYGQTQQKQYDRAPPAHIEKIASTSGAGGDDSPAEGYNAMEFKHLNVPDEIRELFNHIGRYKPPVIDLETKLKPFIPEYIPAVGGIDEFIKVPRPDGKPDYLGLKVLDEAASRQSDPTVLTLQLRTLSKEAPGNKAEMIGRIEHTDENKMNKIKQWISSIQDIHKSKPVSTVTYSRRMPDIEALMQEWSPELEAFLRNMKMPSGDLDLDLKSLVKVVCGILDIPVYENPVESLHVLFTLYLEFKNNPVFKQQMDMESKLGEHGDMGGMPSTPGWGAARGGMSSGGGDNPMPPAQPW